VGLVVSASLGTVTDGRRVPTERSGTALGEVTALGVVPSATGPLIAVGGEATAALLPFVEGRVGPPRWEAAVGFRVAVVAWHDGLLWTAGPGAGSAVDDYDWEQLTGGGFAALDPVDGRTVMSGALPGDVAWGTGGVAVAPVGRWLAAAGRTGRLYLVDPCDHAGVRSTAALGSRSLGIAHLATVSGRVYCGFNRGGYRLHAFLSPASSFSTEEDAAAR
jgi:hypothetical protein